MPSEALRAWRDERLFRIDGLLLTVAAARRANPWPVTREADLNAAVVVALAAEFQGFARDLHDQASLVLADRAARGNDDLADVLGESLTYNRQLDRGNAHPGSLGADFGRLGLDLWAAVGSEPLLRGADRDLDALNAMRNAVAHAHRARVEQLHKDGYALTTATLRQWRSTLDALARTMDAATGAHLAALLGTDPPWEDEQ